MVTSGIIFAKNFAASKTMLTPYWEPTFLTPIFLGITYGIPLSCGFWYVGQTGRCVNKRLGEHYLIFQNSSLSNLASHCDSHVVVHLLYLTQPSCSNILFSIQEKCQRRFALLSIVSLAPANLQRVLHERRALTRRRPVHCLTSSGAEHGFLACLLLQ